MSPIDKNARRDELRRAGADAPASPELGPPAIARGRALRRRRGVVATAAVAVVAVSGAPLWAPLPQACQNSSSMGPSALAKETQLSIISRARTRDTSFFMMGTSNQVFIEKRSCARSPLAGI